MAGMAFRLAEVTKPLASVSRRCSNGTVFDSKQGYIPNKRVGRQAPLLHMIRVYVIKLPMKNVVAERTQKGFVRQGMAA